MSRVRSLTLLGVLAVVACTEPNLPSAPALTGRAKVSNLSAGTGTYLVRFNGNGIPDDFAASVAAMGGEIIFAHAGVGIGAVAGLTEANADALAARSDVSDVVADAYTVLDDPTEISVETMEAPADAVQSPDNPAGAANFFLQWNMRAISAPAAWAAGKLGKSTTRVGILDTGIGYTHADLVGLVDLNASRSFLSSEENARVEAAFPGDNLEPIADLHFHGTHVAATVASNAIRAAGVTSKVTLVGIKVCEPGTVDDKFRGSCPTSAVLGGILYAADEGLDVINMSLGGLFHPSGAAPPRSGFGASFFAIMNAVFHYAYQKGTTVVVAAGNNAIDLQYGLPHVQPSDTVPKPFNHHIAVAATYCDAPHVICVSATGPTSGGLTGPFTNIDALASYSNFGKNHITVAAPGGNGNSAVFAACTRFTIVAIPNGTNLLGCRNGNFVVGLQGTSQATPHVTGLAAIIAGEVGYNHNPDAIAARLIKSADDLGPRGNDAAYGFGRINVARGAGL